MGDMNGGKVVKKWKLWGFEGMVWIELWAWSQDWSVHKINHAVSVLGKNLSVTCFLHFKYRGNEEDSTL